MNMPDLQDYERTRKQIEDVEQACLRLVARAIRGYRQDAIRIFQEETDSVADIAEDVTREALDVLGLSSIPIRLYGKVDYKRASIIFLPDREVEVALMIDSKAEKAGNTATIQMSQTSMTIHQRLRGEVVHVPGDLPHFIERNGIQMQTVTIIVKYFYEDLSSGSALQKIKIACIPNGLLQADFNPDENDTIWKVGRNAPSLGEEFRVRLSYAELQRRAPWRVVEI
jgi:Type II restriction enzyme SfiI